MTDMTPIHIIGGGMAGSEAAWQAANAGARVILHEMRPVRPTFAHQTEGLAELVCSNSFRSDDAETNAVGLLHEEMRRAGSLIMAMGDKHQVPAGGALAVDREAFSADVTAAIENHPNIEIVREEIAGLPPEDWDSVIVATGPLTSPALAEAVHELSGEGELAFFDAIAPILYAESINMDIAWKQSRYDKGDTEEDRAAYINCPMDKDQYEAFVDALLAADKTEFKDWEKDTPYFDACLPIEVMAERGRETLRHGPMKPRGLTNAHDPDTKPYAVVQLRQDNALGTLFNMVGFQTKMKYGAQTDVFKMIPGLENASFARLGGIHRNTFLHSPKLLDGVMRLKARPSLRFAGQITGVEGYVESASMGLLAGRFAAAEKLGREISPPPPTTALGALLTHITTGHVPGKKGAFQPMNVNFGLFPDIEAPTRDAEGKRLRGKDKSVAKKRAMSARALSDIDAWLGEKAQAAE
ncbi:MAG: methylenetetrahydrofolate--tRNA-(uracil(54)-C(5))-methyltransferase (FADH(2)-oxidizing) TrmFO [Oceanicaulis sp.]|uniref:methylenetetrahydrofolate--tRNA-(uracil(54)- C(5))-methyltransferase (FADH(2)-oxidizing) TrmFO n=1 Tax=unclassified Oceanicaulis TaxID=2632123 RepID=UPI000C36C869|nr:MULTISPECIES: methylenetetrahydrofolate--tRNA-(uracil(54)-C(5))-methyltransferase (FADH(2)-oxidizing) TrmFO [unclassified Oceanicaulis]MAB68688.1 methylenetetrahydrofolate--tRNA-(uracil(54)-C(5))-methyltransferase (FADH(2)-oxidizing) TrmFO [Oceanicaulis sp.]MBC38989.1 methylenetetrahydrofolate--tRNA-(uracil(54)-C(5))-methyltransferase (FADH(2)-oxidizing) TrmFO [Oceanicaulis sp.]MBG34757.1 methylenetetrahydrofolate--tRNA-(uracil(54)-C(5))-methyltransferase (FADH(2)-oxidizing) TrmFO [Oceanicaul|tara:strand:+ start:620 stop:2023 length:1404 start_codon:yes stop_codon:yes gene_type:complete